MSLARRFNAGLSKPPGFRRVATTEEIPDSGVATRRKRFVDIFPALKRRAKLMPTLRAEEKM
jgi:hypothetical protein